MTVRRAVATIVVCTLLGAVIGVSIGCGLGTLVPGYYRSVFRNGQEPGFDPVSVGVGQGLTQGIAGGVVVGLAVVALLRWREVRSRQVEEPPVPADRQPSRPVVTLNRVLFTSVFALVLGFCTLSGVVLGLISGEGGAYHRRFLEEQRAIAPFLAGDPAFARVELREYSAGGVYLLGEVPTEEDLGRLRAGVIQAVGEHRAREALQAVSVEREL